MATIFAGIWIVAIGVLTVAFLPSLREIIAQGGGGVLAIGGLVACSADQSFPSTTKISTITSIRPSPPPP